MASSVIVAIEKSIECYSRGFLKGEKEYCKVLQEMCANNSKQLLLWLVQVYLTVETMRLCQEKGDQL
jgi:hypothetical protein